MNPQTLVELARRRAHEGVTLAQALKCCSHADIVELVTAGTLYVPPGTSLVFSGEISTPPQVPAPVFLGAILR